MKKLWIGVFAGLVMASGSARADEGADLAEARECMSCHALDKEVVGPAFKSVAKKYKGKAQAEEMLVKTVVKGSPDAGGFQAGKTGQMPQRRDRPGPDRSDMLLAGVQHLARVPCRRE